MTSKVDSLPKLLARASVVLVVAVGASACSTVPDWVDPTTWIGGDNDQASTTPPADTSTPDKTADAKTPDVSTIPDKPAAPSTSDEQKQVADALAADRSRAEYSGDALKGGTEPAAAPPPPEAATPTEDLASNTPPAATPAAPAAPPPPPAAGPGTLPAETPPPSATPSAPAPGEATPAPAAPTTEVASAPPAVPAVPMAAATPIAPPPPPGDAQLGFRPSTAPVLDASVAQFVPASILARYRQTAAIGPAPAVPSTLPTNDVTTSMAMLDSGTTKRSRHHRETMGIGGPEKMTGAVVANFDALQGAALTMPVSDSNAPAAVVFFPRDTTILNGDAKAQVRDAAKAFLARGGQGYVRVIGHSSSRAANMSAERHLVWNFERSQARASAVARALISAGVPADRVLVQAVGDDQQMSNETMPQAEDANRRAEIFFQS